VTAVTLAVLMLGLHGGPAITITVTLDAFAVTAGW
jgi:hypothetical protein